MENDKHLNRKLANLEIIYFGQNSELPQEEAGNVQY